MEEGEFWQSDEEDDEEDACAKNCLEMEHFLQDFRSGMIPFYEQASDFLKIALFRDKSLEEQKRRMFPFLVCEMVACNVKTFNERLCTPQNLTILFSALENEDDVFLGYFMRITLILIQSSKEILKEGIEELDF